MPDSRTFLRACCRALMCADNPANLTDEERKELQEFANNLAADHGFKDWIDAYHNA